MCEPVCGGQIREPASPPARPTDCLTACFNVLTLGRFKKRKQHIDSIDVCGDPGHKRHHYSRSQQRCINKTKLSADKSQLQNQKIKEDLFFFFLIPLFFRLISFFFFLSFFFPVPGTVPPTVDKKKGSKEVRRA